VRADVYSVIMFVAHVVTVCYETCTDVQVCWNQSNGRHRITARYFTFLLSVVKTPTRKKHRYRYYPCKLGLCIVTRSSINLNESTWSEWWRKTHSYS